VRCRLLGYPEHEKAYRFEEIKSGHVLVSRDARFMEDVLDGGRRSLDKDVATGKVSMRRTKFAKDILLSRQRLDQLRHTSNRYELQVLDS
jgi:hypothetical protein